MNSETKTRIGNLLIDFGIAPSALGFYYIIEAVEIYNIGKSITKIYEEIAIKYNTNKANVESCIRHAFDKVNQDVRATYFKGVEHRNAEYISIIAWNEKER